MINLLVSILLSFSSILWIIPLGETYYTLKNYKKYGFRNPRVISSILYVIGSLITYYDYFIYSKMSGGLDLLTSHWLIWRVAFCLFGGASLFLILTFIDETYSKWRKSSLTADHAQLSENLVDSQSDSATNSKEKGR